MPATMSPHQTYHGTNISHKDQIQKVCIGLGIVFIFAGLVGIIFPGFAGMHLSLTHNLIHLGSGALALWAGYAEDNGRRAYLFSMAFGLVYLLLGVVGFIAGEPGYPAVGHMEADQNLFRVIPNVLELGTVDHLVHLFLGLAFLVPAFVWKKKHSHDASRAGVRTQSQSDLPNSQSNLKNSFLGGSDIQRSSDKQRRQNFEDRL